jgi:TP901 family phage tail tape measure protein
MATFSSGSLSGNLLEIGVALTLEDRFSNQAREASSAIRRLHSDAQSAVQANLSAANNIANVGLAVSSAATAGAWSAIRAGAEFVDTMTTVQAITEATKNEMEGLGNVAQNLGIKTMFMAGDIADGMKFMAMAGMSAKEINESITGAAYAAGATGLALGGKGGAADMITNVLRAFRLSSEEAGRIGDALTKATLSSNMSMTDLSESIRYASSDMVMLGQSVEQTASLIGVMGNAGIQASMAGTAVSNMARYLAKALGDTAGKTKQGKHWASLGIDKSEILDSTGAIRDLGEVLRKMDVATQKMGRIERYNALREIFGIRGNRAAIAIMGQLGEYEKLLEKVKNSEGFAESVVQKRMQTLAGSINIFISAWHNFRIKFAESVGPIISPIFRAMGKVLEVLGEFFKIPVLGPLVGSLFLIVPVLGVITFGVIKLGVWWRRLHTDSTVTGKNMFAVLIAGWKGARLEATAYMGIERAIINQRTGGLAGMLLAQHRRQAMMAPAMFAVGGAVATARGIPRIPGARPIPYPMVMPSAYGGRISAADRAYNARIAQVNAGRIQGYNNVANARNNWVGGLRYTGGGVIGSTLSKTAGAGIGFGARALGFLGGPVGIALMALTFLPMIVSLFKKSNKNQEDGLKAQTRWMKEMGYEGSQLNQAHETKLLREAINNLVDWQKKNGNSLGQYKDVGLDRLLKVTVNNNTDTKVSAILGKGSNVPTA